MKKIKALLSLGTAGILVLGLSLMSLAQASAATLTSASVTLSDSRPGVTSNYTFQASGYTTATVINCIQFKFNTAADLSGTAPTGMVTSGATLASSSLVTASNWTAASPAAGTVQLTYTTGAAPATSGNIVLGGITNGTTAGTAYFLVVNTYTNTNCSTGLTDTSTVGFIYTAGQAVTVTVNPAFTFSVAGTTTGSSVNGATTNFATTSGTIPFGTTPTITTNAIGSQALTVSTNSGNGYSVAVSYTGPLSNGTHNFTDFAGTNAAPTTFSAAGVEGFGYTTNNVNSSQFSSDKWAGLSTTPAIIASSSAAISNATTDVGYQVGISTTTPTGSYSTTVIYTATPLY